MKMKEIIRKTCDIEGKRNGKLVGFCNTSDGPKDIKFDPEDLNKPVDEETANMLDSKYGFGGQLVDTADTALKQRGSKGIFHA